MKSYYFAMLVLLLTSCESSYEKKIIGKWNSVKTNSTSIDIVNFNNDGTYSTVIHGGDYTLTYIGKYILYNNKDRKYTTIILVPNSAARYTPACISWDIKLINDSVLQVIEHIPLENDNNNIVVHSFIRDDEGTN